MKIEEFREELKQNTGNYSDKKLSIEGIQSQEDVEQLIELLSNDSLVFGSLSIKVDDKVSEFFISQLSAMETKPKIIGLELPEIKLSHSSWQIFFKGISNFKSLNTLDLSNSNFDYSNDLNYLGEYLAGNPRLKKINLCSDEKISNKTFQTGRDAIRLLGYLKTNRNLICIKYGHSFDDVFSSNLSKEIQQKLQSNALESVNEERIYESVARLRSDVYLQTLRENLDQFLVQSINDSLLKGTKNEGGIQLDIYGLPLSIKKLNMELARLVETLTTAKQDEEFCKSNQVDNIKNLGKYYSSQYFLLDALDKLYQQELDASPHDKPILHNLREDFLNRWKTVAATKNVTERNKQMSKLIGVTLQNCEQALKEVKDKTSGALIKNLLLIVSALFTAGISLGIYAAVTRQSRAERGSFFFKDIELSKSRIDEMKHSLEDVQTEVGKALQ
ncbi:hypothetical protein Ljor_1700 [Legionella jordanis]|uniref:Uncharacterized protein n=1 Tax=Legionella jordanis TaxID=456 RepID=A0A0W0VBA0_9GAMM|nr:hypothetical protein [Legionella jordanis]KTD17394.1 hypothetical protein Ljor_1700 [Legionella jordanis]RMX15504.1 hypothetical protein EAS68_12515 [Legionella jordanis]VEH11585.1 Uncharacterised protein [Legionella jordanis]